MQLELKNATNWATQNLSEVVKLGAKYLGLKAPVIKKLSGKSTPRNGNRDRGKRRFGILVFSSIEEKSRAIWRKFA